MGYWIEVGCPSCGSANFEITREDMESGLRECWCLECQTTWIIGPGIPIEEQGIKDV